MSDPPKKTPLPLLIIGLGCGGCLVLFVLVSVVGTVVPAMLVGTGDLEDPYEPGYEEVGEAYPEDYAEPYDQQAMSTEVADLGTLMASVSSAVIEAARGEEPQRFTGADPAADLRATSETVREQLRDVEVEHLFSALELEALARDRYIRSNVLVTRTGTVRWSAVAFRHATGRVAPTEGLAQAAPELSRAVSWMVDALGVDTCLLPWVAEYDLSGLPLSPQARAQLVTDQPAMWPICEAVDGTESEWQPRVDDVTVVARAGEGLIGLRTELKVIDGTLVLGPVRLQEMTR